MMIRSRLHTSFCVEAVEVVALDRLWSDLDASANIIHGNMDIGDASKLTEVTNRRPATVEPDVIGCFSV
jgi:hypothetical protein